MAVKLKMKKAAAPLTEEKYTVETYRVLKPIQVSDNGVVHTRVPGDFVDEAKTWRNAGVYERSHHIEKTFVDKTVFDAWKNSYDLRMAEEDAAKEQEESPVKEIVVDDEEIEELPEEPVEEKIDFPTAKKLVTRK